MDQEVHREEDCGDREVPCDIPRLVFPFVVILNNGNAASNRNTIANAINRNARRDPIDGISAFMISLEPGCCRSSKECLMNFRAFRVILEVGIELFQSIFIILERVRTEA